MSQDSVPEENTDDSSGNDSVEQRLTALEEQNKELKTALEQRQDNGLPNVTRRQALGGLLGGGALLGAAGTASADPPSGPGGPPFADEDHDHSGDYLGKGKPVEDINVTELNTTYMSIVGRNQVNVVADLGVTPDGSEDAAAAIDKFLSGKDTINYTFIFPDGEYLWNTKLDRGDVAIEDKDVIVDGFERLGFIGRPAATLRVTTTDLGIAFGLSGEELVMENLTLDIRDTDEIIDAGFLQTRITSRQILQNLSIRGKRQRYQDRGDGFQTYNARFTIQPHMVKHDGIGYYRGLRLPDGVSYPDKKLEVSDQVGAAIPFSADPSHFGTNIWENCYVEEYVDNGFYVRNSPGRNILIGCTAKNCAGANIRLGTLDVCRDSQIVLDKFSEFAGRTGVGLSLNGGQPLAENIRIVASDANNDVVRINSDATGGTIRDIDIYVNGPGVKVIDATELGVDGAATPSTLYDFVDVPGQTVGRDMGLTPVMLENITIRDDSDMDNVASYGGKDSVQLGRPELEVRNLDLRVTGNKNGVIIEDPHVAVTDSNIQVSKGNEAVRVDNESATFHNSRIRGTEKADATFTVTDDNADRLYVAGCRFSNISFEGIDPELLDDNNFGV